MLGVLLVPTAVSCVWFCVFGGIGMHLVTSGGDKLAESVTANFATSIFVFLNSFPAPALLSIVGLVIIIVFLSRLPTQHRWSSTTSPQAAIRIHPIGSGCSGP